MIFIIFNIWATNPFWYNLFSWTARHCTWENKIYFNNKIYLIRGGNVYSGSNVPLTRNYKDQKFTPLMSGSISNRFVSSRSFPDSQNGWKLRSLHLCEIIEIWNFHYNRPTPVFRNYYWFRQERISSLGLEKKKKVWAGIHFLLSFHSTVIVSIIIIIIMI